MPTRWDKWFSPENLAKDKRILASPHSRCAEIAADEFLKRGKYNILDLACGVGRDAYFLQKMGISVTGADASFNGIRAARQKSQIEDNNPQFIVADARYLPCGSDCFDGLYCFGLLHEFTGPDKEDNVRLVISEARRILCNQGLLILTVLSGDPVAGLPDVQLFSKQMLEMIMADWTMLEITEMDDVSCTNRLDYHLWYGLFQK
jgi:ubiquinone/menaquinone biosynthesis C-methylase UbiE